jgi:uncharacterized protein (TIGR02145 family)
MHTIINAIFATCLLWMATTRLQAQVGIGTSNVNPSAKLQIDATDKGFLPPRMTTSERNAISSPATGLVIFNTTTNSLEVKKSNGWGTLSESFVALPTAVIGTQQWMEKNLEVTTYRNGDVIPQVASPAAWSSLSTGAWCWYNNNPENGAIYGKLYNWYAVNDSRGLCPAGWHVPTDAEWSILETALGGTSVTGGAMKTAGTIRWTTPNTGATNSSGFAALLGGYCVGVWGTFSSINITGCFWASDEGASTHGWSRLVTHNSSETFRLSQDKKNGYSVRCIRD